MSIRPTRLMSAAAAIAVLPFALYTPSASAVAPNPPDSRAVAGRAVREPTPRLPKASAGRISPDTPITVADGATGSRVFIFTGSQATTSITHRLSLPEGYSVRADNARPGTPITVLDDTGREYAHVTGAVAFGEYGQEFSSSVRLQSGALVQTVRTGPAYGARPVFARVVLERNGSDVDAAVNADLATKLRALEGPSAEADVSYRTNAAGATTATDAPFVSVPPDYVYDPVNGVWGWHDYCTMSPDSYFSADFRGPCARHDMAYEAANARVPAADDRLKVDMDTNCAYAYSAYHPNRYSCYGVATTYKSVVKSLTYAQLSGAA